MEPKCCNSVLITIYHVTAVTVTAQICCQTRHSDCRLYFQALKLRLTHAVLSNIKNKHSLCLTSLASAMGQRRLVNKAKIDTRKIIGRITYSPGKHKQRFIKSLRAKLASQPAAKPPKAPASQTVITFGSLNVNGLDQEAHWAVTQLAKERDLDVGS